MFPILLTPQGTMEINKRAKVIASKGQPDRGSHQDKVASEFTEKGSH